MMKVTVRMLIGLAAGGSILAGVGGYCVLLATSTGDVVTRSGVLGALVVSAGIVGLFILPLLWMLAGKVMGPVRTVTEGLERVLGGDYSVCFSCSRNDELGHMRRTLDRLVIELKQKLGFAEGVLNGIDTPCVVVDTNEVLTYTNPSLLTILEQDGKPEDYYGQNVAHFFYGDATRRTVLADSLEHLTITKREVLFTGRKGGQRTILINASPLFDLEGQLMGALCIYQDLTDLRKREAEILNKNETIEKAVVESEGVSMDVARVAEEIAQQMEQTSGAVARQTERAMDTSAAMEEMNVAVADVARSASSAAEQASRARDRAKEGSGVVEEAMHAIAEVATLSSQLRSDMTQLGEQAEGIGAVMNVITDIADQTNLLALNAAIEAARAGEAGRGFAVVADEVRKLAEKTMQATKEVGDAIRAIQEGARRNIESVETASTVVERSRELSSASGEVLSEIVLLVNDSTDQVQAIATAAEQQSATSDHINQSVEEVRDISEQASSEMAAASSGVRELSEMADSLRQIIHSIKA